jgi:hypothetical protein
MIDDELLEIALRMAAGAYVESRRRAIRSWLTKKWLSW